MNRAERRNMARKIRPDMKFIKDIKGYKMMGKISYIASELKKWDKEPLNVISKPDSAGEGKRVSTEKPDSTKSNFGKDDK